MTIQRFAEEYNVRISRDECGDQIITGRRGHVYFDSGVLCVMALNCQLRGVANAQVIALGGRHWIGDIWRDSRGRGYRDLWVKDIPRENWDTTLRLLKVPRVRRLTEEQKAKARTNLRAFPRRG